VPRPEAVGVADAMIEAKGKGNKVIRRRCGQKNAEHFVEQWRPGMRLIAMVFGPSAPDTQTASLSIFSFHFNSLQGFSKLATSSQITYILGNPQFIAESEFWGELGLCLEKPWFLLPIYQRFKC
jgi:hypothetical protein